MSHTITKLAVMFSVLLLPSIDLQAKEWRGLIPLKSTRAEVEKMLGLPGEYGRYQFEDERAYVRYSKGSCCRHDDCSCLVPEDTVVSIYVELEVEMSFSALKLDEAKYEKYISPQNTTVATYWNDDDGIIYTVDEENDDVVAIEYLPAKTDCENIKRRSARVCRKHAYASCCLVKPQNSRELPRF